MGEPIPDTTMLSDLVAVLQKLTDKGFLDQVRGDPAQLEQLLRASHIKVPADLAALADELPEAEAYQAFLTKLRALEPDMVIGILKLGPICG